MDDTEPAPPSQSAPEPDPLEHDADAVVAEIQRATLEPGSELAADGARLDSDGTAFDPRIHTGTKTTAGRWRRRKGITGTSPLPAADVGDDPAAPVASPPRHRQLAQVTVASLTSTLSLLFGRHWSVELERERLELVDAWTEYYSARGVQDPPPEAMLLIAMTGYVAPRLAHVETRSRFGRLGAWVRGAWRRVRGRGSSLVARSDSRGDRNGEDAASADAGRGVPAPRSRNAGLDADPPRVP